MRDRQSWAIDVISRAMLAKISGSVTIKFDKGLIVGCKTEHNEKPPIDVA